jgi:hypothetical protein
MSFGICLIVILISMRFPVPSPIPILALGPILIPIQNSGLIVGSIQVPVPGGQFDIQVRVHHSVGLWFRPVSPPVELLFLIFISIMNPNSWHVP